MVVWLSEEVKEERVDLDLLTKIIKPLIIALIFYIVTVLYGLISFHPLPTIFNRGIRAFLIGFFLSLSLKLLTQYINFNLENEDNNPNEGINKNDAAQYENSKKAIKNSKEDSIEDNNKEFNPLDPPVLETEDE